MSLFDRPPTLTRPGLFVTGTDTGVGKTVVACAVAAVLRAAGRVVGVSKPFSAGCTSVDGTLVHADAEALAEHAGCELELKTINPVRVSEPMAPGVALAERGQAHDAVALRAALERVDASSELVVVEGAGGVLVPVTAEHTVLDLASALGYPVLVVARAGLGTLNHTALTVRALRQAGLEVAGLVVNGDEAGSDDPSMRLNPKWLERMTGCPVLAVLPRVKAFELPGALPEALQAVARVVKWADLFRRPPISGQGTCMNRAHE